LVKLGQTGVAVVLSGKPEGDVIAEAGIVVQPKTPKPQVVTPI
jgi:hypothetical protein